MRVQGKECCYELYMTPSGNIKVFDDLGDDYTVCCFRVKKDRRILMFRYGYPLFLMIEGVWCHPHRSLRKGYPITCTTCIEDADLVVDIFSNPQNYTFAFTED